MILELFFSLLFFSLILIIAGKFIDAPGLQMGGYTFLFLMGLVVLFGNLEYKTGEIASTTPVYAAACVYGFPDCNFQCLQDCINPEVYVVNNTLTTTYTYTAFENEIYAGVNLNHVIGFFICIVSGLGFAIVLMNLDKFKLREK